MTFGRVAEALPRAIRLVDWPKLVIFFLFFGGRVPFCLLMFCRWLPGKHSFVAFKWLIIDEGPVFESLRQGIAALLPGMLTL